MGVQALAVGVPLGMAFGLNVAIGHDTEWYKQLKKPRCHFAVAYTRSWGQAAALPFPTRWHGGGPSFGGGGEGGSNVIFRTHRCRHRS